MNAAVADADDPRPRIQKHERVLRALTRGPVRTEAVRELGSINGRATIHELREMGFRGPSKRQRSEGRVDFFVRFFLLIRLDIITHWVILIIKERNKAEPK